MTCTMNYLVLSFFLIFVTYVCSQDSGSCDLRLTDEKRKEVDVHSYCSGEKPCVVKCCGENEVIHVNGPLTLCKNIDRVKKILSDNNYTLPTFDYSNLNIYKNDDYDKIASKKFKDFTLLYSESYHGTDCAVLRKMEGPKLLEKGTLMLSLPNHYYYWTPIETPDFCVDMVVGIGTKSNNVLTKFYFGIKKNDEQALERKLIFTVIGMLTSAFFLFVVLVVYSILHQLRNIQGMLLYAYVVTLMGVYILKSVFILLSLAERYSGKGETSDCTVFSQITYFLILASFFWLKIMSFDIWWTFRGSWKLRVIHRRGINVKMMIYASYAYGMPAVMTIFAVIMDQKELPPHIVKPMFDTCFVSDTFFVYLYVPLMILTGCNCLLFLMTMYNIWLIRRNMASFDKATAKRNDNNHNTFMLYIKLSSLMGVSWILELIQARLVDDSIPFWLFVLLNVYNLFIGVIIFFLFVFKTNIFLMLCKRFKIERWAHRHFKVTSSTGTEPSKSSKYSRSYSRTQSTEIDGEDIAIKRIDQKYINKA